MQTHFLNLKLPQTASYLCDPLWPPSFYRRFSPVTTSEGLQPGRDGEPQVPWGLWALGRIGPAPTAELAKH